MAIGFHNKRIYSTDQTWLATLKAEYIMLGFEVELERGCLTVLTRRKSKKNDRTKRKARNRNS